MNVKVNNFILWILGAAILIPHFPSISYGIARIMDFFYLSIIIVIVLFLNRTYKNSILFGPFFKTVIVLLFIYILAILLGCLNGFIEGYTDLSGFSDLYRPVLWLFALYLGANLTNIIDLDKILNFFKFIAVCSLLIAIFQKIGINILYLMYSGPGHIISNRTTGICQDFADYSFLQVFGAIIFFIKFEQSNKSKELGWCLLLCFSVLLSTSKAGLGLMFAVLGFIFLRLMFSKRTSKYVKYFFIASILSIIFAGYLYIVSNESFSRELVFLINMDSEALPSISERQNDFNFVKNKIWETFSLNSFTGFGSASLIKNSYIEVAWLAILFRTGFIGFIAYYSLFFATVYYMYKTNFAKIGRTLSVFLFFAVAIDFAAAMTNRILAISLFFILLGFISVSNNRFKTLKSHE